VPENGNWKIENGNWEVEKRLAEWQNEQLRMAAPFSSSQFPVSRFRFPGCPWRAGYATFNPHVGAST
jgi:hypothetical protein